MASASPAAPIPVYLLTGFLGSGKTTLLSRLVHDPAFSDTAVIINEFGAVGLDHVLLEKSDDGDVVLLDSGCLCCASNSPLQDSLESLYYRRLRGEVPAFMRVVVETSGLADPLPLINAIHADRSVARHYRLGGVVTTVDAVNGVDSLQRFRESAVQLAVADRVVLTKTDIASDSEMAAVHAAVAKTHLAADVVTSAAGARVLEGLVSRGVPDALSAAEPDAPAPGRFSHLVRYGIDSHVLRIDGRLSWSRYAAGVATLQRLLGERLLRAKGILSFDDGQTYAIHGVRHLFADPSPLHGIVPDAQQGVLVLITSDATTEEIAAAAQALGAQVRNRL